MHGLSHVFGPPTPHDQAVRLIRDAHDLGYTFFDTAECYTGTGSAAPVGDRLGQAV